MEVSGKRTAQHTLSTSQGSAEDFLLFCIPCDSEWARVPACDYCENCEEHHCKTCFKHHKKPAPSRNHVLLDIDSMPKTPSVSKSQGDFDSCPEHGDEKLKIYCSDHSAIVCGICVPLDHRTCKVDYIPKLSQNIPGGSELLDLMAEMKTLGNVCRTRMKKAKENIKCVTQNHGKVLKEITLFRKKLNACLDEMEHTVTKKINGLICAQQERFEKLSADLESIIKETEVSKSRLDSLLQKNQRDRLFTEIKKAQKQLNEIKARERKTDQEAGKFGNLVFVKTSQSLKCYKAKSSLEIWKSKKQQKQ